MEPFGCKGIQAFYGLLGRQCEKPGHIQKVEAQ